MASSRLQDAILHIEVRALDYLFDDEEDGNLNRTAVWVPEDPRDPLPEVISTFFGRYRRIGSGVDTSRSPPEHYGQYVLPCGAPLVQRNGSHMLVMRWCRPPSIDSYLYVGNVKRDA